MTVLRNIYWHVNAYMYSSGKIVVYRNVKHVYVSILS